MEKKFDFLVFIGRFQPFHQGHKKVVQQALELSKELIIIVGSAERPRCIRNPFIYDERLDMIDTFLGCPENVHIGYQVDYTYNDEKWIASIQGTVNSIVHRKWRADPVKIGIIGYDKDHTSYYMKKFPAWEVVNVEFHDGINATDIRNKIFESTDDSWFDDSLGIIKDKDLLLRLTKTASFNKLRNEYKIIKEYRDSWKSSPYPPTFVTVDSIVTQSGHILLVRRRSAPGEGLWAMPGGFIKSNKTVRESMWEELDEETSIDVPKPVIMGSIAKYNYYDDPNRSVRGRTITHAFHIKLADREKLPKVKGGDDADKAKWFSLAHFMTMRPIMFEDHFNIVEHMLGL